MRARRSGGGTFYNSRFSRINVYPLNLSQPSFINYVILEFLKVQLCSLLSIPATSTSSVQLSMVDPATILHTFQKSNGTLSDSPSPSPRRRFFNSAAQNVTWNTTSGPHTGASNAPTPSTSNAATIHSDAVAVSTTPSIISRVRIALSDIKQHLLHSLPLSADKSQVLS
jgi:hypothetical protein